MKGRIDFFLYRLLFFLMGLTGLYLLSPLGQIQSVKVSGNHLISSQAIVEHMDIRKGTSLIDAFLQRKHLENMALQTSPQLLDAQVKIFVDGKVYLKVDEAKPLARWKRGKRSFYVMKNGEFLPGPSRNNNKLLPLIRSDYLPDQVKDMLKDLDRLDDEIRQEIAVIRFSKKNGDKVDLLMNDGQQVLGKRQDIFKKMAYYKEMKAIIGSKKGWLNLEEGAYFKARGSDNWEVVENDWAKNGEDR